MVIRTPMIEIQTIGGRRGGSMGLGRIAVGLLQVGRKRAGGSRPGPRLAMPRQHAATMPDAQAVARGRTSFGARAAGGELNSLDVEAARTRQGHTVRAQTYRPKRLGLDATAAGPRIGGGGPTKRMAEGDTLVSISSAGTSRARARDAVHRGRPGALQVTRAHSSPGDRAHTPPPPPARLGARFRAQRRRS